MFVNHLNTRQGPTAAALSNRRFVFSISLSLVLMFFFVQTGCQRERTASPHSAQDAVAPSESILIDGTNSPDNTSINQPNLSNSPELVGAETDQGPREKPEGSPLVLFLTDRDELELPELSDAQLHKNFTLVLLSAQPDLRARKIIKPISSFLTDQQKSEAMKLILAQDYKFLKLQRRRSEILEQARDGNDIEGELKRIDSEIVATSMKLQSTILKSANNKTTK
ncbi:MAG: hypothetical protein ACKVHR_11265 [Pirellulales bacterium]